MPRKIEIEIPDLHLVGCDKRALEKIVKELANPAFDNAAPPSCIAVDTIGEQHFGKPYLVYHSSSPLHISGIKNSVKNLPATELGTAAVTLAEMLTAREILIFSESGINGEGVHTYDAFYVPK